MQQLTRDMVDFLVMSERGKREYRVWRDASRHFAERRGYYAVDRNSRPTTLCVSRLLLGGYISENIPQTVGIAHAQMCRERHIPEATITSPLASRTDLFAQEACNQFLSDHWLRNHCQRRRDWLARNLIIGGDDFIELSYDPNQIGTVEMNANQLWAYEQLSGEKARQVSQIGQDSQQIPIFRADVVVGGTTEKRVSADHIFVEDGPVEWDEVTRFVVMDFPSVHAARMQWADAPGVEYIRSYNIRDLKGAGQYSSVPGAYSDYHRYETQTDPTYASKYRQRTIIAQFWLKEGTTWRRIVRTGENLQYEIADDGSLPLNPFTKYAFSRTGDFWSQGLVQGMIGAAYSLNVRLTQLSRYLAHSAKTVWMVPFGSEMSVLSNDYNTIVRYDGLGTAPIMKTADQSVLRMFQEAIEMDMAFLNIGGQLGEIGLGNVPSRTSAVVLRSTQDAVYSGLSLAASHLRDSDIECARKILYINQHMADVPRMAKVLGNDGTVTMRAFQGADIMAGTDVKCATTDMSPQGRTQRLEAAIKLDERGMFLPDPMNDERIRRFFSFVDGSSLSDIQPVDVRYSITEANDEYSLMMAGKVAMLPAEFFFNVEQGKIREMGLNMTYLGYMDPENGEPAALLQENQDDAAHVEQHTIQARDPNTPKNVRDLLNYHISAEHKPRIELKRLQAQAQQAEEMRRMSLADSAGQQATTVVQAEAQKEVVKAGAEAKADAEGSEDSRSVSAPATPASGGRRSGMSRSK